MLTYMSRVFSYQVSVYAPKDHLHQANFACDSAASILAKYENFFGEKYPLQKQGKILNKILSKPMGVTGVRWYIVFLSSECK